MTVCTAKFTHFKSITETESKQIQVYIPVSSVTAAEHCI